MITRALEPQPRNLVDFKEEGRFTVALGIPEGMLSGMRPAAQVLRALAIRAI